jgi:hypothetical protein
MGWEREVPGRFWITAGSSPSGPAWSGAGATLTAEVREDPSKTPSPPAPGHGSGGLELLLPGEPTDLEVPGAPGREGTDELENHPWTI